MSTGATKKRKRSQLSATSGSAVRRPTTAPAAPRPPTRSPFFVRRAPAPTATPEPRDAEDLVAAIAPPPPPPPPPLAIAPSLPPTPAPASTSARKHGVKVTPDEDASPPAKGCDETRPELYDPTVRPRLPSAAYWRKGGDGQRYATLSQRDWDAASDAYGGRRTPRPAWWVAHDDWWAERDRERALQHRHQRRQQQAKKQQQQKQREDAAVDERRHRPRSRETQWSAAERKKAHVDAPISARIARQLVAFLRYGASLPTPVDRLAESTGDAVELPIPLRTASDKSVALRAGGARRLPRLPLARTMQ